MSRGEMNPPSPSPFPAAQPSLPEGESGVKAGLAAPSEARDERALAALGRALIEATYVARPLRVPGRGKVEPREMILSIRPIPGDVWDAAVRAKLAEVSRG